MLLHVNVARTIVFFTLLSVGLALIPQPPAEECECKKANWEYQKTLTVTRSGLPCQRWDSQTPHDHDFTDESYFPDDTVADAGNFCRNPDNEIYAWCYTADADTRWEFCDIATCTEETEEQWEEENLEYQKTLTETHSGITCQRWDSQSPREHSFTDADFPDETIADAGNYCRNPGDELYAWCYTTEGERTWDYCDILYCPPEETPSEEENTPINEDLSDVGREETLLILESFTANPTKWNKIFRYMRNNADALPEPVSDLYATASKQELKPRVRQIFNEIMCTDVEDIEDSDIGAYVEIIQQMPLGRLKEKNDGWLKVPSCNEDPFMHM